MSRPLRVALTLVVSAAAVTYILYKIDLGKTAHILGSASVPWVVASAALTLVTVPPMASTKRAWMAAAARPASCWNMIERARAANGLPNGGRGVYGPARSMNSAILGSAALMAATAAVTSSG